MSGIIFGSGITIGSGITAERPPTLMLSLDAADYTSGPWVDTVSGRSFTLNGGVSYSSADGGSLVFDPASSQYAFCSSSLPSMSTWTVEVWHYYDGTNSGGLPCIVTETFAGGSINYTLGWPNGSPNLQAGFFNGGWQVTPTGYSLTPGAWYQIVGTYDGSTVKMYVNNSLVGSTAYTGTPTSSGQGIRLMERWDSNDYWGGNLAIVNIYEGALSQSGVTASWNANKARFGFGTLTIATNDGGGLTGWSSNALSVSYDPVIISDYTVGSTITFYDNTTATITGIDNYGPLYIDIFWDTPKTGTLFPITLSN